ncbi:hypothetical protein HK096_004477, partial [Nowakowskiella sp. JEL0078]
MDGSNESFRFHSSSLTAHLQSTQALVGNENGAKAVSLLQQELSVLGFAPLPILPLLVTSKSPAIQTGTHQLFNILFSLLQHRKKENAYREELTGRLKSSETESDRMINNMAKMSAKFEMQERELSALSSKLEQSTRQIKELTLQLSNTKEELKITKSTLSHSKAQYQHELRKKQRDLDKCKERVQKTIALPGNSGITTTGTLRRAASLNQISPQKSNKNTNKLGQPIRISNGGNKSAGDTHIYELVIQNYEEREKQVISENTFLREMLMRLYFCVAKNWLGDTGSELNTIEGHFQLPVELLGTSVIEPRIEEIIEDIAKCNVIGEARSYSEKIEVLQNEIDECQIVIQEQSKLLEKFLQTRVEDETSNIEKINVDTSPRNNVPSREGTMINNELDEEKEYLRQQREQLESERKNFLEAAIRMGRERTVIQAEKEVLEREKRSFATAQLLQSLPKTPAFLKSDQVSQSSPAPNQSVIDQSTPTRTPLRPRSLQPSSASNPVSEFNFTPGSESVPEFLVESDTIAFTTPSKKSSSFTLTDSSIPLRQRVAASPAVAQMKSALKKRNTNGKNRDSTGDASVWKSFSPYSTIKSTPSSMKKSVTISDVRQDFSPDSPGEDGWRSLSSFSGGIDNSAVIEDGGL